MTLDRRDPGDTKAALREYARGSTDIRATGFWITFILGPTLGIAYLLLWLIGRAL